MSINTTDLSSFLELFNRGGSVLDFSDRTFNDFTGKVIGVPVKTKYAAEGLSKGKSLSKFCYEENEEKVKKLLSELLKYYELHVLDTDKKDKEYGAVYDRYYKHCKNVVANWSISESPFIDTAEELKQSFSSDYLTKQIEIMMKMQEENPTESIGKAKELIESCCKTILTERNVSYDKTWNIGDLTKETFKLLKLMPEDISETVPAAKEIKGILGNLKTIALNVASLRNEYGTGHGKEASYKGLQPRHAKLAVGSCITLVEFLWDSHTRK